MNVLRALVDDLADVVVDLSARRGRALLLATGVALSTGALVASWGIARISAVQVSAGLAAESLDILAISVATPDPAGGQAFPLNAQARVADLPYVRAAGMRLVLDRSIAHVSRFGAVALRDGPPAVLGVTSGYLQAVDALPAGGPTWAFESERDVAFVGIEAAAVLGIPDVSPLPPGYRLRVAGTAFDVVAVLPPTDRADLTRAITLPYERVVKMAGSDAAGQLVVRTEMGAGPSVARVLRSAVNPRAPQSLTVSQVVDLKDVRRGVETELVRTSATIGALLLALTTLLIANGMVVSAVARTAEIGLRRALGSSRSAIARLFLVEGGLLGAMGGLAGGGLGVVAIVVVARANRWGAETLTLLDGLVAPLLGLGVGVVASAYPAWRAARISPAIAVRVE